MACVSAAPGFGRDGREMFWHLLLGPVIGGQVYREILQSVQRKEKRRKPFFDEKMGRICPSAELSARAKLRREYVVTQFLLSFVEYKFDLDNAIQNEAGFSYAIAAMDKVGGWEDEEGEQENWLGPRLAASMWIYTKAVVCNGQKHMQNLRIFKLRSIMEAINWVCVTMPLTSTCGCRSSFPGSRKCRKPCNMTLKSRA